MDPQEENESTADNEAFVILMQLAKEDPDLRLKLLSILNLDTQNRRAALTTIIEEMKLRQAPPKFLAAMNCFMDDAIAEEALQMIEAGASEN